MSGENRHGSMGCSNSKHDVTANFMRKELLKCLACRTKTIPADVGLDRYSHCQSYSIFAPSAPPFESGVKIELFSAAFVHRGGPVCRVS